MNYNQCLSIIRDYYLLEYITIVIDYKSLTSNFGSYKPIYFSKKKHENNPL